MGASTPTIFNKEYQTVWFVDTETFKYDWMMVAVNPSEKRIVRIVNNRQELLDFYEANKNTIWVTYNGRHYDQYIIKGILCDFNPKEINDWIIVQGKQGWQFSSLFNNFPFSDNFLQLLLKTCINIITYLSIIFVFPARLLTFKPF